MLYHWEEEKVSHFVDSLQDLLVYGFASSLSLITLKYSGSISCSISLILYSAGIDLFHRVSNMYCCSSTISFILLWIICDDGLSFSCNAAGAMYSVSLT